MTFTARLAGLGFDLPQLRAFLRTAAAACAALFIALALGLEHPQWAAMTVWAASQPTRGQLIEKSLFRAAGTLSGVCAGVVFVVVSGGSPWLLTLCLAAWIAACTGIGNLQRGFVSYGTMLAGYSASMVALLASADPGHVLAMGGDRLLTILVGVVVALAVGYLFAPQAADARLLARLRHLAARTLRRLAGRRGDEPLALLKEMAAIEESLEPHGAGSLRSRRLVHAVRRLLMAEVSLALAIHRGDDAGAAAPALLNAATALESGASGPAAERALRLAGESATAAGLSGEPLLALGEGFATLNDVDAADAGRALKAYPAVLHRDGANAWRAALRAAAALLAVGALWSATGLSVGPYLLLGVSIFVSLFSTFDNPAGMMRFVLIGQALGASAALSCRFLVWPFANSSFEMALMMVPFVLAAPFFFAHRRTSVTAFDFAMTSLLLLRPIYPPQGTPREMGFAALAVVLAPVIAYLAYRLVFPIGPARRSRQHAAAMVRDVEDMARAVAAGDAHPTLWRARLYHRLLRLVRLAERNRLDAAAAAENGLRLLNHASAILTIDSLLHREDVSANAKRSLRLALGRLARLADAPDKASAALRAAAAGLPAQARAEARRLAASADAMPSGDVFGSSP